MPKNNEETEVPIGTDRVQFYANLYRSYLRRNKGTLMREDENWRMYSGVDKGQWDPAQLQMLIEEKRAPHQVNFIQQDVNKLLGNLLQNELDTEFIPSIGEGNDSTIALNSVFLADRDMSNWEKQRRMMLRAGLVMRGSCELYIDYTNDPQGRINQRYINHNRIMFDPDWTSDNINDNKHIIQWAWMDPEEISLTYDKKTPEIENAISIWKQQVANRSEMELNETLAYSEFPEFTDMLNGRFLVIQISRLDRMPVDQLYDMSKRDFLPIMSNENMKAMMMLKGSSLRTLRNKVAVCKVATVVPGLSLSLMLEDTNHPIQMGRYPYMTWSYMNINGVPQGQVDAEKDLQQIFNKRESQFTHWQTTATNGAEFIEEGFFADPQEFNKYVDQKNIPGGTFKVSSGSISQGKIGIATRPRENIPNDLHESADRALQQRQEVIPSMSALSGGEGKSGESATLFQNKRAQALVSIESTIRSVDDLEKEFGECYFTLAKQLYSGSPREIYNPSTKETVFLNIPTMTGEISNDFSKLKRHQVKVSKSKRGISVREELLNRYTQMMPFFQNPILRSQIEKAAITVLPNIPDKEIQEALLAADAFMKLQLSRVQAETMQNQLGIATSMKQMEQFNQPPQQQLPPTGEEGQMPVAGGSPIPQGNPNNHPISGGGISVEGKSMKPGEVTPVDVMKVNQMSS